MKSYIVLLVIYYISTLGEVQSGAIDDVYAIEKAKCLAYVSQYGFIHDQKTCSSYCCGGCFDRYCCSNSEEEINQNTCQNNHLNKTSSDVYADQIQTCLSYVDRNDNVIEEDVCTDDKKYCCGSCTKRSCCNEEYNWLKQDTCQNTVFQTTEAITTTHHHRTTKHHKHHKDDDFYFRNELFIVSSVLLCLIILFTVILRVRYNRKKCRRIISKQNLNETNQQNYKSFEPNMEPPSYPTVMGSVNTKY